MVDWHLLTSFLCKLRCRATFIHNLTPLHLAEIKVFKSDLRIKIVARIWIFKNYIDSLPVGAKEDTVALLAYAGWGSLHTQALA